MSRFIKKIKNQILMKKIVFIFYLLINVSFLFAQSEGNAKITGLLFDETNQAIPYASVSLFNMEKELLQGCITDDLGAFNLDKIPVGSFQLEFQYLGFQTINQTIEIKKKNEKLDLGTVILKEDSEQLGEVLVTAEKSKYSLRLDKKIFEVGKDALTQGGSAVEVLGQVPQVAVQPDGTVTLRGDSQVQILINGRRSGMTMNNALDQIPSDNIERVEVITNPSASFDASGSAGIINIILKKNMKSGFSGQLGLTAGIPANYVVHPGVSYKSKKVNLFSNLRWRYSDYNGLYSTRQERTLLGTTQFLNQDEIEDRHDDGRSGYFGMDYYLNDKNTITAAYYRSATKDTDYTELTYALQDEGQPSLGILRVGNSVENRNYNQLEFNYTKTFKQEGRKWEVSFQNDFWNSTKDWDLSSSGDGLSTGVAEALRTTSKSSSKDYVVETDMTLPLKKKGEMEFGLKFENRIVKNDYLAETFLEEEWTVFNQIDNKLNYGEKIGAAYTQYGSSIKKLEYMLGLRVESTFVKTEDEEDSYSSKRSYVNVFPSVHLSYPLAEKHSMQLTYSRRINRPSLWDIYPFNSIKDFNVQEIGNPNLDPSFTDGVELSTLSIFEKITINPSLYYKHTQAPFQNILFEDANNNFVFQPINVDKRSEVGGDLSLRYQAHKTLTLMGEFNVLYFTEEGNEVNGFIDTEGTTWSMRFIKSLRLWKDFQIQTVFDFQGAEQSANIKYLSSHTLSFGLSKNFMKDKINVGFSAFNVLDSRVRRAEIKTATYQIEQRGRRYGPRFALSFLYKINQNPRERMRQQQRQNR